MTKQEIIHKLFQNHRDFANLVSQLNDKEFMFCPAANKWTAGQQLDHIYRSVSPVLLAFTFPKFVPSMLFGKAIKPSMDYNSLIEKYHFKLKSGGIASGRFLPKSIKFEQKEKLRKDVLKTVSKLIRKVEKCSEQELDKYLLPHPLLGKLTFREMLYFTIYHAEHHHLLTMQNLKKANNEV